MKRRATYVNATQVLVHDEAHEGQTVVVDVDGKTREEVVDEVLEVTWNDDGVVSLCTIVLDRRVGS